MITRFHTEGDQPFLQVELMSDAPMPAIGDYIVVKGLRYWVQRRTIDYTERTVDIECRCLGPVTR